jgi:hypothetical protein
MGSAAPAARSTSTQLAAAPPPPQRASSSHFIVAAGAAQRGSAPDLPSSPRGAQLQPQLQLPGDVAAVKHAVSALESYLAASQQQQQQQQQHLVQQQRHPVRASSGAAAGDEVGSCGACSRPGTSRTSASQRTIRVSGAPKIDANGFPSALLGDDEMR